MRRLALLVCFSSMVLAGGAGNVASGYFLLPYQTWHCRSGQTLQLVPTNTQLVVIRRHRGRSYGLNFVPGVNGRYSGPGITLGIRRNGDFVLQLGRFGQLHDVCSRPHAGN